MSIQTPKPKFIFVNPNSSDDFKCVFQKIILERIRTLRRETTIADA